MKLWKKRYFYHHNWFWCRLHGIDVYHLNKITGNFIRYTANCTVDLINERGRALYANIY